MAVEAVHSLSPTMAWQLRSCPHSLGLRRSGGEFGGHQAKVSPAVALGRAAHEVVRQALNFGSFDETLEVEWFDQHWRVAVDRERLSCFEEGSPETWRRYSIVRRGTRRVVQQLRSHCAVTGASPIVEEERVWTDGRLNGRPDVVMVYPDGSAEVVDFKTGASISLGVQEKELHQLFLYAILMSEVDRLEVVSLRIVRCDGPDWQGSYCEESARDVLSQVYESLRVFNENLTDTETLATPGTSCADCRHAHQCDVVWRASPLPIVGVEGQIANLAVEGEMVSFAVRSSDGTAFVVGCPEQSLEEGKKVRIAHLREVSGDAYRWVPHRTKMLR